MRIVWHVVALVVLHVAVHTATAGDDTGPLRLRFDRKIELLTSKLPPSTDFWKYFITVPDNPKGVVRDPMEVARYIVPHEGNDPDSCRLRSRANYAGVCRAVPSAYESARLLSWKWSVSKHPQNGRLGGTPNDQSMEVYVFFREVRPGNEPRYSALGFVWTHNSTVLQQTDQGRMPWKGAPSAALVYNVIRNGKIPGLLSEEVNLPEAYQKAFGKPAPPIWGIVVMADSNEVEPDVGQQMTTDALIRDIQLAR